MEEETNTDNSTANNSATTEEKIQIISTQALPVSVVMPGISSQPVAVTSVIQSNSTQPSVIQTTPLHTVQVQVTPVQDGEEQPAVVPDTEVDRKRRQDILSRRPSYRKILNDLSSTDTPGVARIEEENTEEDNAGTITLAGAAGLHGFQTVMTTGGATIQIANPAEMPSLQTLTMTNAGAPAGTIVQSIQTQDGTQQFFVPTASGDIQAYQIRPATSLPQGVVMASTNLQSSGHIHVHEEAGRKRELRLMKNREAAKECRRKKKEYIKCLENRVAVLENQNKTLIEELKSLKELYCHKSE
ncbi:cAMP-responsive element modulator-like [Acanthaster planci]|uniref:cAMP-responsive element modulator-like n=1 Tax=Acanthaster planci TaxID=133434 RepID=A0A8B7XH04_ACAPL|nr:cAMP-responsive element modulator-like [Acanthaster planci]XP_022080079.1 cAMP-responsive element modulator-like [Acanthaster planci]